MAVINHYTVGTAVTVTGTWTNKATGTPVDPSDARVDVVGPNGVSTTYTYSGGTGTVTRTSAGVYTYTVDTTNNYGRWQYRWWSPAGISVQTAGMNEFIVDPFPIANP